MRRLALITLGLLFATLGAPAGTLNLSPSDDDLFDGAADRIEKIRKTDLVVVVQNALGKPVPGARVEIEQTRHAFLFGCNAFLIGRAGSDANETAYRKQFAALFNTATLPFYWTSYEPRKGELDDARLEQMARWCLANDITPKGHPLAWNNAEPGWLPNSTAEVRELMMARIEACVKRFQGIIDLWDVVNEATHFERDENKKHTPKITGMWEEMGRVPFVRECFRHARIAGPRATLAINDYRTDEPYAALIRDLCAGTDQKPFDVIGIQSHMHSGTWSNTRIWEVCERFAKFGVPLHFSETTILPLEGGRPKAKAAKTWPPVTGEAEKQQADDVERFYTMLFSHAAVVAITWWDFSDRGAWQRAPAGLVRADMTPRPAYDRLQELVHKRWWTKTSAQTAATGAASSRVFLGDHKVTVTTDAGARTVMTVSVRKREPKTLIVTLP
jgi:endo-1,4-beta-xylanase